MIHRPDQLLDDTVPPDPPAELRGRVLAAAREAMGRAEAPDVWKRIWGSRPVRLAWAVSVGLLIFGHIAIGGTTPSGSASPAMPLALVAGSDDELAEVADLGRLTAELPGWEVSPRSVRTQAPQHTESEDRS